MAEPRDEYLVVTKWKMSDADLQKWMNEMHKEGWCLKSVHEYQYIFKKAVEK